MTAWRKRGALTSRRCRGWPRPSPLSTIRRTGCCRPTRPCGRSRACSATMPKPLPPIPRSFRRKAARALAAASRESLAALAPLLAGARTRRLRAPLSRRSPFAQHRGDRRRARSVRRASSSMTGSPPSTFSTISPSSDGSRQARAHAARQRRAQRLSRCRRRDRQSRRTCGAAAVPFHAGGGQGQGRVVARATWRRPIGRRPRARRPAPISLSRRNFLAPAVAAPHRHRRIVGERQVGRGPRDRPSHRRLSRGGACAKRCRAQATCSAWRRSKGCRPMPTRKRSRSGFTPCAASARLLALEGGRSVIVDAVHARAEEREALAALAAAKGVPFTGLWLEAPAKILRDRIAARTADVSDATPRAGRCSARIRYRTAELCGHRCEPDRSMRLPPPASKGSG